MGVAAYNRGSAAIAERIRQEFDPQRGASDARVVATNARMVIDRLSDEIARLRGSLALVRDDKERNFAAWLKLDSHFRGYRKHAAGMVRRLVESNTEKERQRMKLARCVREHLTPEQWLEWSERYDRDEGPDANSAPIVRKDTRCF